jgi:methylmalonyl-CoA mutase N-terminal domain/subunit
MPNLNTISISGYHMREAGATGPQALAFTLSDGIAYVQLGVDAGLNVDDFVSRFTFLSLSGSMEMFKEIALQRAARRIWAKIMKERFGSKDPRNWLYRSNAWGNQGYYSCTAQRPLNNLTRAVIGGIAGALSGGNPSVNPPYDEALGLGWSLEAVQLTEDARRIIQYEAGLNDVIDPLAGSYYVEALTDQMEQQTWDLISKVDAMGGAVAAIEKGLYQQEIARSAFEYQKDVETGKKIVVGVNRFTGENELEVLTSRLVAYPYDPEKRARAEERQLAVLAKVKKERDNAQVKACLRRLEDAARDESVNLLPLILESVKAYATVGEMCGVLRRVFGEYQAFTMGA